MRVNTFKAFLVVLIFSALSCDKNNEDGIDALINEASYSLDIEELSGLTALNSDILYTVSDNTNKIYKISSTGKVLGSFPYTGEDLEGVAVNKADQTIYIVEERKREIVQFDNLGNYLRTIQVSVESNDINSGLEGICVNPVNNHIFVLNEKSPGKLIELNSDGNMLNAINLNFALDYSGLCINPNGQELWIISDESKKIFKCDTSGNLLQQYSISINKIEGLSIDFDTGKVYIVSDSFKKLFEFKLPV